MVKKKTPGLSAADRATRHSCDLAIELRKAEAALKKAKAIVTRLEKALAAAKPRVTRHSRDL